MSTKYPAGYSEPMLQIMDDVSARDCGGRTQWKREWIQDRRFIVWRDSLSIKEFQRRGNLSEGKARELDNHFASLHPMWRPLHEIRLPTRRRGNGNALWNSLEKQFGDEDCKLNL